MADTVPDRRTVVKALGAGALLLTAACTPARRVLEPDFARAYSRKPRVAPRISMDAVIRVTIGHRPYRATGFRVEREQFDDKFVIHNCGARGRRPGAG